MLKMMKITFFSDLFPIEMGKQELCGAAHNTSEGNPVTHSPRTGFSDSTLRNYMKPVGISETKSCFTEYKPPNVSPRRTGAQSR